MGDKTRVMGAAGGALGLGGLAAALGLCCTLPWAVALLGVGGAVTFARLAVVVPYALIAAAALLGVAFWWAYRPPPRRAGAACPITAHQRALRGAVWIAALLVAALAWIALNRTVLPF